MAFNMSAVCKKVFVFPNNGKFLFKKDIQFVKANTLYLAMAK